MTLSIDNLAEEKTLNMSSVFEFSSPLDVVAYFDRFVVGQAEAKRKLAIAIDERRRYLKLKLANHPICKHIIPKNILMVGDTGVGKTELARRMADYLGGPFYKCEATKFTEVGYVGRDVDSIIRDLVEIAIKKEKEISIKNAYDKVEAAVEDRILDALLSPQASEKKEEGVARQAFRKQLKKGTLEDTEIEIDVKATPVGVEIMAPPGLEEMTSQLQSMFSQSGNRKSQQKTLPIRQARKLLQDEEAQKLINEEEVKLIAIEKVENSGYAFSQ